MRILSTLSSFLSLHTCSEGSFSSKRPSFALLLQGVARLVKEIVNTRVVARTLSSMIFVDSYYLCGHGDVTWVYAVLEEEGDMLQPFIP